ncbi:tetratricopeptide repeat protein [Catenovulum sp. SM1970]|uniref:YfgM family protein n=1 Tax=Marinifaba aquimaris TaxID=2741323 RepID=UPI0015741B51|nr:tetratricopeptide repeat protein [Marinifaba aquimaris]NTS75483.1 tetratricopeptide repeat protein [Marinifaba aquimaris]
MEAYTTEEQQVEAIKKFWQENGLSLVAGVVLGLGGVYGYNYYQDGQILAKEQASIQYADTVEKLATEPEQVKGFIEENKGSGYSELAALMLAKQYVEAKEFDKAASQLTWVKDNATTEQVKAVASLRLARVLFSSEQADKALTIVSGTFPDAFAAQVAELKGDILLSQGKAEQARSSYQTAADKGGLVGNPSLQMKIDDLAVNTTVVAS